MTLDSFTDVRNDALRLLSNGLYVLTTCVGDTIHAATVSWVTQVSFQPPLVLVALRRNSHLANAVRKAHRFALNVLAADQEALAEKFFTHLTASAGTDELAGYAFRSSQVRCPLLTDSLGWLECRLAAEPPTPGDHSLILGEVTGAGIRRDGKPLVLWATPWFYGGLREGQ
jgi:flavin reductase (DIM6/NTAB) family NADH-FMN oxidoreductase RutF